MPALILKNITKKFGPQTVLDSVSLELNEGELMVLLGPSGCGKSTLLRLIAGLEELDTGEIYLGEKRIDRLRPKGRQVAMVFQNYALYPHMTVAGNLGFPLSVAGLSRKEKRERVAEVARLLGLDERLKDKPSQLSGGQRQRVALGRAIIRKPKLFLLDEPLSNLDADLRGRMRQEIVRIQRRLKTTTVYVTHDQTEALTMADRVAVLHDGRMDQIGSPEDLYRNPASLFVARFIGQPRINTFKVENKQQFRSCFDSHDDLPQLFQNGRQIVVGVRPEAIRIEDKGMFTGTVTDCEYLGDQYVIGVTFKDTTLRISGSTAPQSIGCSVQFSFNDSSLIFFDNATGCRIDITEM